MDNQLTDKQRLNQFYLFLERVFGGAINGLSLSYIDGAKRSDNYLELQVICQHEDIEDDIIRMTIRIPIKYAESKGFTEL